MFTTIPVLRECITVLMEGSPFNVPEDMDRFRSTLETAEGVKEVHDLHVWSLNAGRYAMSAHISSERPSVALKSVIINMF
jgi:Co/Zn/Cd efflux system component